MARHKIRKLGIHFLTGILIGKELTLVTLNDINGLIHVRSISVAGNILVFYNEMSSLLSVLNNQL